MAKISCETQTAEAEKSFLTKVALQKRLKAINRRTKRFQRGTTVEELVVTLCIIMAFVLLLVFITVPIMNKKKRQIRQKVCFSNMKSVGIALLQYASDNDDTFPSAEVWKNHAFTTDKLDGCPDTAAPAEPSEIQGVKGYSYNEALTTTVKNHSVGVSYDAIKIPALTVAVCEEAVQHPTTDGPNPFYSSGGEPPAREEKGWLRHDSGAYYLFADGHVGWHRLDDVGYSTAETSKGKGIGPTFALKPSKKR